MGAHGVAEWTEELRRFAAAGRAVRPLPDRSALTLEQEWQFNSDVPGLVAAQEILGGDHELVVFLLEEEFADAAVRAADPRYARHVHVWSRFLPELEPAFAAAARSKHPIPAFSSYWQHAEGTRWASNAGRGGDHLWRWDGQQPELLEEAMTHWLA